MRIRCVGIVWLVTMMALITTALSPCLAAPRKKAIKIFELRVLPASLTLDNARDARRLVISGRTADGFWADVTDKAQIKPDAPLVTRGKDGFFRATKAGKGKLFVSVGALSASVPMVVKSVANPPISFVREVMPVLSRTGCNAGTCHGSAKGKNGFKLSLRGYDPDYDYHALVDDIAGRRFNRAQPSESLMLQKPVQEVAHQGGMVFEQNSPFYALIYKWISERVKSDAAKIKRANSLELLPKNSTMGLPGEKQQIIVLAHYPDGTTRDVTGDAVFSSSMKDVATVTAEGRVEAVRRDETAILVRYEGNYAANAITVIGDRKGDAW